MDELYDAMLNLYHDAVGRKKMGVAARQKIEMQFSIKAMLKLIENTYIKFTKDTISI